MTDFAARIEAARRMAEDGGIPTRRSDARLYAILAECLSICEQVIAEGREGELREHVRVSVDLRGQDNAGRGRRYAYKTTDAYILVARAVLGGVDNRNSTYRYGISLREAGRRGIASGALAEWLTENGGVNTLFRGRPVVSRSSEVKTLHLNHPVRAPKGRPFTLTLMRDERGFFNVLAATTFQEAAE